jgi:hypothetical protein
VSTRAVASAFASIAALATGCGKDLECKTAVNEAVTTVLDVECTSHSEGTSWVEYGLTDAHERGKTTEVGPTDEHVHHLYGIPELTEVQYAVHFDDGEHESVFEGTATTGELPPTLQKDTAITVNDPSGYDEPFLMMCQVGTEFQHITVYDRDGNIVWYKLGDGFVSAVEAVFDPDNERLLYMQQSPHFSKDVGAIFATNWVQDDLGVWPTELAHHGIELQEDGRVSYLALDARKVDLAQGETLVAGDRVMEIDLETGSTEEIYNVWDNFVPSPSPRWNVATYPGMKDWTHANGAHYYEDSGTYLLSLANLDTIL